MATPQRKLTWPDTPLGVGRAHASKFDLASQQAMVMDMIIDNTTRKIKPSKTSIDRTRYLIQIFVKDQKNS